ncbi:hypothetical protein LIER_40635 [Lithospermum erythrorhizon]|uniref:Uncharacterized protein n=1 Tax=Lithospermum erythrorhizon TaxID=34254 RepID=A0AAV3R323_LITER
MAKPSISIHEERIRWLITIAGRMLPEGGGGELTPYGDGRVDTKTHGANCGQCYGTIKRAALLCAYYRNNYVQEDREETYKHTTPVRTNNEPLAGQTAAMRLRC